MGLFGKSKGESIKIGLSRINQLIECMEALKEEDIPKDEHELTNTKLQEFGLMMLNDLNVIKKTLEEWKHQKRDYHYLHEFYHT